MNNEQDSDREPTPQELEEFAWEFEHRTPKGCPAPCEWHTINSRLSQCVTCGAEVQEVEP